MLLNQLKILAYRLVLNQMSSESTPPRSGCGHPGEMEYIMEIQERKTPRTKKKAGSVPTRSPKANHLRNDDVLGMGSPKTVRQNKTETSILPVHTPKAKMDDDFFVIQLDGEPGHEDECDVEADEDVSILEQVSY